MVVFLAASAGDKIQSSGASEPSPGKVPCLFRKGFDFPPQSCTVLGCDGALCILNSWVVLATSGVLLDGFVGLRLLGDVLTCVHASVLLLLTPEGECYGQRLVATCSETGCSI